MQEEREGFQWKYAFGSGLPGGESVGDGPLLLDYQAPGVGWLCAGGAE